MRRSLRNGVHAMLPRRLLSLIFLDYAGTNRPLCLSTCAIESRRAAFLQHHKLVTNTKVTCRDLA